MNTMNVCVSVCVTQSAVGDAVHLQDEVILKEHISNNREEVDQDQTQNSCQDNRAAVSCHTLDYVQKSLFPVHQVKQLQTHTEVQLIYINEVHFCSDNELILY